MLSLVSYGEVLVDFLPSSVNKPSYIPLAGGAPANVAVAYAKLGGTGYFAGGISEDDFGNMLFQTLEDEGVDTVFVKRVKDANTAIVLVSIDKSGERSFNFYRHNTADTKYGKAQVDKITWLNVGVFHYCSNTLTNQFMYDETIYALNQAKANNVAISFDVNLRQQLWSDITLLPERIEACLKKSDIIKLSRDEAKYLAEIKLINVEEYINYVLSLGTKLVIVTDGSYAVQVASKSFSVMIDVPAISPIDTTGAGDSFISGFLFFLTNTIADSKYLKTLFDVINQQKEVSSAVLFGAKCGAFTCQKKGAFTALPKLIDL